MAATPKHAARVLGLTEEATLEDVKSVRRKMALKYHPDRCNDVAEATRHMARINAAADTLIAYLKNKPRPAFQKPKPDFKKPHAQKTAPEKKSAERSTSTLNEAPRRKAPPPKSQPIRYDAARMAKRALVEAAAASYHQVLSQIGQQKTAPSVDLKILRFEVAAA